MLPRSHGWVLNNVPLSYWNCCVGILPGLYWCLVIISRIIEAIHDSIDRKETLCGVFLPSQFGARKMIFHYAESEQMNLNTFATYSSELGLVEELTNLAGLNSWAKSWNLGWMSHTQRPTYPSQHMFSHLSPWTAQGGGRQRYSHHLVVGATLPRSRPPHPILWCPTPSFSSAGIYKARSNPGSKTVLWGGSITCSDCSYPPHPNMLSQCRKQSSVHLSGLTLRQ